MIDDPRCAAWKDYNIIAEKIFNANVKAGYREIIITHTKPPDNIGTELLWSKYKCRPQTGAALLLEFVMSPHTDNIYGLFFFVHLINKPMFDVDPAGESSLKISLQLFTG